MPEKKKISFCFRSKALVLLTTFLHLLTLLLNMFTITSFTTTTTYYYYYIHLTAFFQDNLGKPAPERILDFTGARDDGVAVASAGPYVQKTKPNQLFLSTRNSRQVVNIY